MKKGISKAMKLAKSVIGSESSSTYETELIKGDFSPVDAADILLSFINDKIKFHTVRQLQLTGKDQARPYDSNQRIQELKHAKKEITDLILMAKNENCQLEIKSSIQMKLKKNIS